MTEEEKIFAGRLFDALTKELRDIKHKAHILCQEFNALDEYDENRLSIIKEFIGEIGENVWIAANVIIIGGVHIGDNAVIGAGSVVTKDIPPNYLAYGVPCKPVRMITEKDSKLDLL